MRILYLAPWLPWPPFGGARIRIFEMLRHLSRGHRVTLLAPIRRPEEAANPPALRGLCEGIIAPLLSDRTPAVLLRLSTGLARRMPLIQAFHYSPAIARHVRQLTAENSYDIIHIEFPFLASYVAAVAPRSRAKKVLSMHNIETVRLQQELKLSLWGARHLLVLGNQLFFGSWEAQSLRKFDGILAVSEPDRQWARQHAPGATLELVPNGVDTDYFSPRPPSGSSRTLVFTGLMDYPPNVDAAAWFCEEILPLVRRRYPDISLRIVGDKPSPRVLELARIEGVDVTGRVPDIRPYLSDGLALVVPLRSGGGTRLKILEAMAMQRPVISTRQGAEGLDVTPGADILLGDTALEIAEHIFSLIEKPGLAEGLGRCGRSLVEARYDWKQCLGKLESFYETLASRPQMLPNIKENRISSSPAPVE